MIDEIRDVDLPWRTGFLAKSTTLVSGCWWLPTENNLRVIRVFRGLKRERGDTAHSMSEFGTRLSDLPGRLPDLTMPLANQHG